MKVTTRKNVTFLLTLCFLLSFVPATFGGSNSAFLADLFFENGVIYTVDKEDTVAETLAVKNGKIVFVGSAREGRPYKEFAAKVVNLKGGMLLPGFIDGHIHTMMTDVFDFTFLEHRNVDSVLQAIAEYIKANPNQGAYYGFGVNPGIFEGDELFNGPKKGRLDDICADKPIAIYQLDGHSIWLNSKGFELSGITKDTISPPGGRIPKESSGDLWGTVYDSAMSLVPDPVFAPERLSLLIRSFQAVLNSFGYTSIMTLPGNGYLPIIWEAYSEMERNRALTLRVRGAQLMKPWDFENDFSKMKELMQKYNSDLVKLSAAKIFTDGTFISQTAYLMQPYENTNDYGTKIWEQDELNNAFTTVNKEGIQVHVHSIGDAAVKMTLDAAEYAKKSVPGVDCRNVITHLQLVDASDFPRIKELNIIPVLQPYWHFKMPGYWEYETPGLGARAETRAYPLKTFVDNGAKLSFSSDYPVLSIPNPFHAIETGVTRNLPDGPTYGVPDITNIDDPRYLLRAEERLDIKGMIRGFTANAAYSIFAEDIVGTLEVGKLADLIVIDQNLFSINPLKISDTKVLRTYLSGNLVYSHPNEDISSDDNDLRGCNILFVPSVFTLLALLLYALLKKMNMN